MMASARRALSLAVVSAVARAPAFLVPILIAAIFGSGQRTDAYFIAYSAVLLLGGTLGQGVEQATVPFAAREMHRAGGSARRYLDAAARMNAGAGLAAWLVCLPILAGLAVPELRHAILVYALCFTPLTLAWCAAAPFSGALVARGQIARATGSLLWRGAGALAGVALVPLGGGLWGVALGLGAGEVGRVWWLRRALARELPSHQGAHPESLHGLARAASAQAGAGAAIGAAPLVERLLAATLGVGAVSDLEYAMRLLSVAGVLFDGALVPLILARWTNQITTTGVPPSRREVLRVLGKGLVLAAGIAAVLALSAGRLVPLVLGHGRFTAADAVAVARVLQALSIAYVANMGASLVERRYVALTRNRTLAALSVGRAALRLLTVWLSLQSKGLLAFPIGFAVSEWTYLLILVLLMREERQGTATAREGR
jgi:peptidoglycan biosynthesis protein MviN/MurJ (putative lipid II flippase)